MTTSTSASPSAFASEPAKQEVYDFWEKASCGEALLLEGHSREDYELQSKLRYELEPYIPGFAGFDTAKNKDVLEIGVGLGADHQCLAASGARMNGIDLTPRAVEHTKRRLALFGLQSNLQVMDAERLEFPDATFGRVYSWGVLHHSPNTSRTIEEVHRVLKPGGDARIMVYHKSSMVGYMLWVRYALLRLRPWTSLSSIYSRYLESPGTKAYSIAEARRLCSMFKEVKIHIELSHGDLLSSGAGQRHQGALLKVARALWPRPLIRTLFKNHGLFMLIEARK